MAVTNVRSQKAVDPFLSFRFIVSWAPTGCKMTPCAYVNRVGTLTRTTDAQTWREGAARRKGRDVSPDRRNTAKY
jgi:hypothetical protein